MALPMNIVSRFTPPGNVNDLTENQKDEWSQWISATIQKAINGRTYAWDSQGTKWDILNNAPRPQFFNPLTAGKAVDFAEKEVSWIAFPKQVKSDYPTVKAQWKAADSSRDLQDEYCEWSVSRDVNNNITSVSFTCEGPEYWKFLGKTDPDKVLDLYQIYVNPNILKEELFDNSGSYIPRNQWNKDTTNGAMHLIQRNNTLGAEIELAGGASMVREKNGQILDNEQQLIACGQYGAPGRHSDPKIGAEVNTLSRAGGMVSLRDPVGLYFDEFVPVGWKTPDQSDPRDYWQVVRGDPDTPVRVVYEIPNDKGFTVSDITINGERIQYASQIAEFIKIKLVGIAQDFKNENIKTFSCVDYQRSASPAHGGIVEENTPPEEEVISSLLDVSEDYQVESLRQNPFEENK